MIEYSRVRRIHFVGIGGSGMSGIAEVLFNMGFEISGSDIAENDMVNRLRSLGISIYLGHDGAYVKDAETVVYSSAVTEENVEIREAAERKIPIVPRAEMLAELMRLKFSIAVAGTHGKTTTTSMLASILANAGKDPTYVVGGKLKVDQTGAKLGRSDYLVAEADESDGTFLHLFPTLAVVTNIENDHLDHYKTMESLLDSFTRFCNKVPFYGSIIINSGCALSRSIMPGLKKRVRTYAVGQRADVDTGKIQYTPFSSRFEVKVDGETRGVVELNAGGKHNIENALAAITASLELGIGMPVICEGLGRFYLPQRRFQVLFKAEGRLVIDDYAHHPSEIRSVLDTLRSGSFRRIIVVFQPHRYTRLHILMDDFVKSFAGVDRLIVARIYAANQEAIEDVNGLVLAEKINASGGCTAEYVDDFDDIARRLKGMLKPGDALAFLSAGDLTGLAHRFAGELEKELSAGEGEKG